MSEKSIDEISFKQEHREEWEYIQAHCQMEARLDKVMVFIRKDYGK